MREKKGSYSDKLYDKIRKTKGAKFNAYERLGRRQKRSFYAIGILSAHLIIINLLQPFGLLTVPDDYSVISFISVSLSIMLLVFVTIENSTEYNLKGNNFHNCTKDLGRVFNDLDSLIERKVTDTKEYDNISNKYSEILDKYHNHSPIDYEVHKTKHKNDFKLNLFQKNWVLLKANCLIDLH